MACCIVLQCYGLTVCFCFKQKTAYEMRISDWSSDVCSSDLTWDVSGNASYVKNKILELPFNGNEKNRQGGFQAYDPSQGKVVWVGGLQEGQDRKSVVKGRSVSGSVDLGGRGLMKKNNYTKYRHALA